MPREIAQRPSEFGRRRMFAPTSGARPLLITAIVISVVGAVLLFFVPPYYVFGPIILILMIAGVLKYPILGLYLYMFIVYLRPQDLFGFLAILRPNIFILVLTVFSLIVNRRFQGKTSLTLLRNDKMFLAFLVAAVLSNVTSFWFSSSVETTIELLKVAVFYFTAVMLLDNELRIIRYITYYLLSIGFVCLVQIYTYLTVGLNQSTGRGGYGIIIGGTTVLGGGGPLKTITEGVNGVGGYSTHFLANASELGLGLCVAYPLCYYLFKGSRHPLFRFLALALLVLLIVSIVVSGSRGAFVGLVATLIYLLYKEKRLLSGLVVLAILSVPAYYLVSDRYVERIESIRDYQEDVSVNIRFQLWRAAVDMIADYPVFGVGTGNFPNAYGGAYRAAGSQSLYWSPHNVFIQIITEMGLVGFTIYILFIATIFWINKKTRALLAGFAERRKLIFLTRAVDVGLVGYIVAGQFITATYYPHLFQLSVWASAIYMVARSSIAPRPEEQVT